MQEAGRITMTLLLVFSGVVLVIAGVLWAYSPGKPRPLLDNEGRPLIHSISEKIFLNVNGVQQGMFIKGTDLAKPVLLYLHGGMPEYFLAQRYPTGLEDVFTVVWWEQRGSGISCSADIPPHTMTLEQMLDDTRAVTEYLRNRFGREKIYLMGHSGGTFIGIQAAARNPKLYHAYIGVAQMSCQLRSERLAYEYMVEAFQRNGDRRMTRRLQAAPVSLTDGIPDPYLALRDQAMHRLGIGTMHGMKSVITGIFLPSLACRAYTATDKINLWRSKSRAGVSVLWNEMLVTDLAGMVPTINIPVYFIHGEHDYTVSYALARDYFRRLNAPVKGFYSFQQSAHSPQFEEPERMGRIMREDVLRGTNGLADNGCTQVAFEPK